jgi:hypothetical protein
MTEFAADVLAGEEVAHGALLRGLAVGGMANMHASASSAVCLAAANAVALHVHSSVLLVCLSTSLHLLCAMYAALCCAVLCLQPLRMWC